MGLYIHDSGAWKGPLSVSKCVCFSSGKLPSLFLCVFPPCLFPTLSSWDRHSLRSGSHVSLWSHWSLWASLCLQTLRTNSSNFYLLVHYSLSCSLTFIYWSFPGSSDGKRICLWCGRPRFNLCVGRSPGEGNGNPLQYSCLENSMDRGYSPGVNSFNFYLLVH